MNIVLIQTAIMALIGLNFATQGAEIIAHSVKSSTVTTAAGTQCRTYLFVPSNSKSLDLVFLKQGTGLYSSGEIGRMDSSVYRLFRDKKVAVLTVDKPGISVSNKNKNGYDLDRSVYFAASLQQYLDCLPLALDWATGSREISHKPKVVFRGHSEGAEVAVRFYSTLLGDPNGSHAKIVGLVLSGLPTEPLLISARRQVKEEGAKAASGFEAAIRSKDNEALVEKYGGLPLVYFEENLSSVPSLLTAFFGRKNLVNAPVHLFQGLDDRNTPADGVKSLEKSLAAPERFQVRYYQSAHALPDFAYDDMETALKRLLAR